MRVKPSLSEQGRFYGGGGMLIVDRCSRWEFFTGRDPTKLVYHHRFILHRIVSNYQPNSSSGMVK